MVNLAHPLEDEQLDFGDVDRLTSGASSS